MTVYTITLRTRAGDDGIRRAALKLLLRRFGLRALKVEQTSNNERVALKCSGKCHLFYDIVVFRSAATYFL
jgi:hypothetical protein